MSDSAKTTADTHAALAATPRRDKSQLQMAGEYRASRLFRCSEPGIGAEYPHRRVDVRGPRAACALHNKNRGNRCPARRQTTAPRRRRLSKTGRQEPGM